MPGNYVAMNLGNGDFAMTLEDALAQCEAKRQKRICHLRKQIKALEAMTFAGEK